MVVSSYPFLIPVDTAPGLPPASPIVGDLVEVDGDDEEGLSALDSLESGYNKLASILMKRTQLWVYLII